MLQDKILVIIEATTKGAISEVDKFGKSVGDADKKVFDLGKTLKTGLAAGATALVGTGLVSFLNNSVQAFQSSQAAAQQFARATNASVEQAGKFTTVMNAYGLEMNDLIEINAEFSKKIVEEKDLLSELGIQVSKNADGSVNMTETLVDTIDTLGSMEDGLLAAQAAAVLFGEEGSKQLAAFYLAGVDVSDLMDRINFVDKSADAQKFAAVSQEMDLAFQQLQITIGQFLVPVLTDLMDVTMAIVGFMQSIPGPVLIAAGAMTAFAVASKNAAIMTMVSEAKLLVTALIELGTAGAIAGTGLRAAGDGLLAVGSKLLTAATVVTGAALANSAFKEKGNAEEFARRTDIVTGSLEEQTKAFQKQDGVVSSLLSIFHNAKGEQREYAGYVYSSAKATLESAEATEAQKKAAQGLVDVMDKNLDGNKNHTAEIHRQALETEEARKAQQEYAAAFGETAAAQLATQEAAQGLTEMSFDLVRHGKEAVTTWQDFADAAIEANNAVLVEKQAAELAAIAQGQFATSIQGAVDWLDRLTAATAAPETGLNNLQTTFADWKKNDPKTWGNEWIIGFEASKAAIQAEVNAWAALGIPVDQVIVNIQSLLPLIAGAPSSTLTPEQKTAITDWINNTLIPGVQGTANEVPVPLTATVDPTSKTTVQTDLSGITGDATVNVDTPATGEGSIGAVQTEIDNVLGDKTANITINATWGAEGGYTGEKARLDYINSFDGKTPDIDIWTHMHPDYNTIKQQLDAILAVDGSTPDINIWTHFNPDGYSAIKSRLDALTRDRTVNIDINTRGLSAAEAAIRSIQPQQSIAAAVSRIVMPDIQPVNIVRVNVDGNELRATIRDELLNVRRSDDLAAAMGVVA